MTYKQAAVRALLTFIDAFLAVVVAAPLLGVDDFAVYKMAAISGGAALITFVRRAIQAYWDSTPELPEVAHGPRLGR